LTLKISVPFGPETLPVPVNGTHGWTELSPLPAPVTFPAPMTLPEPEPFALMVTTLSAAWVVAVPEYFPVNTIGFFTAVAAAEAMAKASNATTKMESFLTVCPFRWSRYWL
jgi:hypothetical protein